MRKPTTTKKKRSVKDYLKADIFGRFMFMGANTTAKEYREAIQDIADDTKFWGEFEKIVVLEHEAHRLRRG